jgi:Protein of unknown function (DUF4236)
LSFYVRTSVKAGPFRFNLSRSGVGVSAGIPGFRIGTGPRGNYVRIGSQGIYYRATSPRVAPASQLRPTLPPPGHHPSDVVMQDVTGVTSMSLEPTGGDDVIGQLNVAASRHGWGWPATIIALVAGLIIMPYGLVLWALAVPVCWWLFLRDKARRTVVLFYDVTDAAAAWFDQLVTQWRWLTESQKLWRIVESGRVETTYQHKTNAGASNLVNRITAAAAYNPPKHLATNVAVPSVTAGKSSLYFLPDRLLVRDGKHYSDVSYNNLKSEGSRGRFIEGPVQPPTDSTLVDRTWQYVNVKGGPDRRYANNPVLPIMLYGNIDLASPQGLSWRVQVSRADAAPAIAQTLGVAPAVRTT